MTVKDENGLSDEETITITVTEPINEAPKAVLTANILSGSIPLQVQFTGDQSNDDIGVVSYLWEFKDGTQNATIPNPIHTFTEVGTYLVELTVTDAAGLSNKKTVAITANEKQNEAPVAIISADKTSGDAPLEVQFTGQGSIDDKAITSYLWQFKDGQPNVTVANPTHTFTNPGNYLVELTVQDQEGLNSTNTISITVNSPNNGNAPAAVANTAYAGTGNLLDGMSGN